MSLVLSYLSLTWNYLVWLSLVSAKASPLSFHRTLTPTVSLLTGGYILADGKKLLTPLRSLFPIRYYNFEFVALFEPDSDHDRRELWPAFPPMRSVPANMGGNLQRKCCLGLRITLFVLTSGSWGQCLSQLLRYVLGLVYFFSPIASNLQHLFKIFAIFRSPSWICSTLCALKFQILDLRLPKLSSVLEHWWFCITF